MFVQYIKWHLAEWEVRGQDAAVFCPGPAQGWRCHSMGWGAGVGGKKGREEGGIVVSWGQIVPEHSTWENSAGARDSFGGSQTGQPGNEGAACSATGVDQKYGPP